MEPPRVTIGMPVFNGEDYLDRAIESLVTQDFADFEIVARRYSEDPGSRDDGGELGWLRRGAGRRGCRGRRARPRAVPPGIPGAEAPRLTLPGYDPALPAGGEILQCVQKHDFVA